jgi:HlyD family secretion protein
MRIRYLVLVGVVMAIAVGTVWGVIRYRRSKIPSLTVEAVATRDLEAIVSASGKIQPKRLVNISADTPGRVVNLAVNEGERVSAGQFLLQIDPKSLRTRVDSGAASLQAAEASLAQLQQAAETARVQLEQARRTVARQRELSAQQLTTREALDKAESDVRAAESALQEREKQAVPQSARIAQERAGLESARYDLSKVRIESPIAGIVTRRNIQEGETAVVGTMNNAGTVLLTLADMSIIQAEIEVDETNIPSVAVGQPAKVSIDAFPDRTFKGHVSEIGNSPIQSTATSTQTTQATNFKVTVVIDEPVPDVRPGFTCTADITTATRKNVAAVPIAAVAVRELVYASDGSIVPTPPRPTPAMGLFGPANPTPDAPAPPIELQPNQTRKETEGVFLVQNGRAVFRPIRIGIAGERYFEVLSGLAPKDQVVTGPYNTVRGMSDGDTVTITAGSLGASGAK